MTEEGAKELEKQTEQVKNAIYAFAKLLTVKDGRGIVDEVHIRAASRAILFEQISKIKSTVKWVIYSMTIFLGLASFQMSIIYSSLTSLWILPIFSIVWVGIVSYVFKHFL